MSTMAEMRNFLEINVSFRRDHMKMQRPPGLAYLCMEDFVLQEGHEFDEFSIYHPTEDGGEEWQFDPGMPKSCFDNAYRVATSADAEDMGLKLRYVEGYAVSAFLPVMHAWVIDEYDRIIDVTWCGTDDEHDIMPTPGEAYLGVIIDLDYVTKNRTNQNCSMIDAWEKGWPLLQQKYIHTKEVQT